MIKLLKVRDKKKNKVPHRISKGNSNGPARTSIIRAPTAVDLESYRHTTGTANYRIESFEFRRCGYPSENNL